MKEKKNILTRPLALWFGAMVSCALWGLAFPSIKIGYSLYHISAEDTGGQIIFAGCRFFLAGILAILIGSFIYRRPLWPKKHMWGKIFWLSMLQTTGQYFFFYIGLAHTTGVNASIIQATNVFVALIVARLVFRQEKLSANKIWGSIIGFGGVVLLNAADAAASGGLMAGGFLGMSWAGEGAVFLSTVMYAFSSAFMKEYSKEELPFTLSGYQFVIGGLVLTVLGLVMKRSSFPETGQMPAQVNGLQLGILLVLAGISAIAYSVWGQLLKYNPVSRVAVFGFMTPVFGVIFSSLLLHEKQAAGWGVVVLSLALVSVGTLLAQRPETQESASEVL